MLRVFTCLTVEHDWRLIILAVAICFLGSVVVISLFSRARATRGRTRLIWLGLDAAAAGCGIWATHFIAMLAYAPGFKAGYDAAITGYSLLVAVVISGTGLAIALQNSFRWSPALGGAILGTGIAAMHFTGMSALEVPARLNWSPGLVISAITFGVVLGSAAFFVAARRNDFRGSEDEIAPTDGTEPDQLLKNADMALYRAKADGRGTYRFFEADMDARAQSRRALELDLRAAVACGQFELYYQPIQTIGAGEIIAFEALVRWNHPTRGMLQPNDFIPLAEQTGLIVPIGDWVLRTACSEAAGWSRKIHIAVNLSAVQFKNRKLVESVEAALSASGLAPDRLELEITETILLHDYEGTLATLRALRNLGVRISMDDFGTGYSSLSYLHSFPFDKIKIDQSFIRELANREESMAIVRAITGLGKSLGISTTAEGVETREQLRLLRSEGCTEVQGYLFSPPCPAAEVETLLLRNSVRRAIA